MRESLTMSEKRFVSVVLAGDPEADESRPGPRLPVEALRDADVFPDSVLGTVEGRRAAEPSRAIRWYVRAADVPRRDRLAFQRSLRPFVQILIRDRKTQERSVAQRDGQRRERAHHRGHRKGEVDHRGRLPQLLDDQI